MKIQLLTITLLLADCFRLNENIHAINQCLKYCDFGSVKLLTSEKTDYKYKVEIPYISSGKEYDKFMFNEIYKYCDTDLMLIIQQDAWIVNPDAWNNEFLKYDWIGAPWWYNFPNVGNGGFSIRSKRLMKYIADNPKPLPQCSNEDNEICLTRHKELTSVGFTFAPEELAHKFSWEGNGKYPDYTGQFGFHGKGNKWCK